MLRLRPIAALLLALVSLGSLSIGGAVLYGLGYAIGKDFGYEPMLPAISALAVGSLLILACGVVGTKMLLHMEQEIAEAKAGAESAQKGEYPSGLPSSEVRPEWPPLGDASDDQESLHRASFLSHRPV